MEILRKIRLLDNGRRLSFWCPGCKDLHVIVIDGSRDWTWNQDTNYPTVTPSVLSKYPNNTTGEVRICHLFIRSGELDFLSDSTHEYTGMRVPMESTDNFFSHDKEPA